MSISVSPQPINMLSSTQIDETAAEFNIESTTSLSSLSPDGCSRQKRILLSPGTKTSRNKTASVENATEDDRKSENAAVDEIEIAAVDVNVTEQESEIENASVDETAMEDESRNATIDGSKNATVIEIVKTDECEEEADEDNTLVVNQVRDQLHQGDQTTALGQKSARQDIFKCPLYFFEN